MSDPEQEANTLLERCGITRAPVPIARVASHLKLRVIYEPFEGDVAGMLFREKEDGIPVIVVNSLNAKVRQRFTVAHEIGHHVLHENALYVDKSFAVRFRDSRSSLAINPEEIQANRFAACLLMPEQLVEEQANRILGRAQETS